VITRNADHFHIDFHYNISEQPTFCTEIRTRPAPSRLRTPAMNTGEYPPSIHSNNAKTTLGWHGWIQPRTTALDGTNCLNATVDSLLNWELQMKTMRFNTILLIAPLVAGCASMAKVDRSYTQLFAATAAGVGMMDFAVAGKPEDEPSNRYDFMYSPLCVPFFILDLPVSLVTDVVTSPHDLCHIDEIDNGEEPQQRVEETNSTASGALLPKRLDAVDRPVR